MESVKVVLRLCFAFLGTTLLNVSFAQESLPLISPAAEQSRANSINSAEAKRQFRTWQAQYRAVQGMMRDEQYKWIGHNPQRPYVNSGEAYSVPYNHLIYPTIPVGRSIFYQGGTSFHY